MAKNARIMQMGVPVAKRGMFMKPSLMQIEEDYKFLLFKMILGITGSIGSGKTTAAGIFSKYHYSRIEADEIGHELLKSDKIKNQLVKIFGNGILDKKMEIDRKKLGNIVFNDRNKLEKLNSIMHPMIINEIKNQIKKIQEKCGNDAKIIVDAPLLLETSLKDYVDMIVVVKSDKNKIIKRLNKRFPREKIERILIYSCH